MERFVLTDAQWAKMEPRCLGKPGDPGRSGKDTRLFVEAVCRSRAVDCPHRQSLARSAPVVWTLEQRLHALSRLGEGGRLAAVVRRRLGRARHGICHGRRHHHQGPPPRTRRKRGTQSQAIGRSKGGLTTKILALTDALGNLVRVVLLPGQRFDTVGVPPLIDGVTFGALIGDTAFDSNALIADLDARGAKGVIAQHPRRTSPLDIDAEIYKWRHLIENFFCKLKEFKRIALRADKTDQSFAAMIHLAAAVINSR
jgi:transposase